MYASSQEMLNDLQLEIPCVSQFTLNASLKGNKLDFHLSMNPSEAAQFYSTFVDKLRQNYKKDLVKDGKFGAHMQLSIENDGPVTIILDSKQR